MTKSLRSHAAQELNAENMSLWAGQGLRLITESMSAKEILDRLIGQVNAVTESSWKGVDGNGS
jgi:nitronate monooxygenase